METIDARHAWSLVRDGSHFQWYLLPLLLFVLYLYNEQAAAGRWHVVFGGLAFWLMDWISEIVNALIAHGSGFAPIWGTPGASAYVILIGLNVEISAMFAIMGLLAVRLLPQRRDLKWLGIGNRWLLAAVNAGLCVLVECWLNHIGVLTWEWRDWNAGRPWLIFFVGYLPFFLVAYRVHDMRARRSQIVAVGVLAAAVALALAVFGAILGWI
ncbi:hypothetical protein [Paludibacterium yongneupense]|uniref:hypothetical protein n=1 Tax=Paludibacterium yongneupense TaxID=400061 RepID=UPI000407D187|nr:hypothetical protein [Paludibacterium yongneupense]